MSRSRSTSNPVSCIDSDSYVHVVVNQDKSADSQEAGGARGEQGEKMHRVVVVQL